MQKIIRVDEKTDPDFEDEAECYALAVELGEDFCRSFIRHAQMSDKIVLLYGENAAELCLNYEADGVVLDLGADELQEKMSALRKKLGKRKYIGLFARNRKHESMVVSEVEPDFVVFRVWKDGFDRVKELTDWYNDFFLIQSAAWLMDDDVDVSTLNTDFVIAKK